MAEPFVIRDAVSSDYKTIARLNSQLAEESEGKRLDLPTVELGVQALLADSQKGRYFVACDGEQIVGQLMHTYEWSDWRNGQIWWLQSVYVIAGYRRRGIFRSLFGHLVQEAHDDPHAVGLRLYVEHENTTAQQTYHDLGFSEGGYHVLEQFFDAAHRLA